MKTLNGVQERVILKVALLGLLTVVPTALLYLLSDGNLSVHSRRILKDRSDLASQPAWHRPVWGRGWPAQKSHRTAVIYLHAATDRHYQRNFEFFLQQGVSPQSDVDYYIMLKQVEESAVTPELPPLPPGSLYIRRNRTECFDWGEFAWVLLDSNSPLRTTAYRFFIFLNSSARGPFLPAYWPERHWTSILTSRITEEVKMVGASINCGGLFRDINGTQVWRQNPHIQSYVFATDMVGLAVLRNAKGVLACHATFKETVWHSEMGASQAILDAGYNLDSLMLKYQGVDWRDARFHMCNNRTCPLFDHKYDGRTSLNPLEQLFVKVKEICLDHGLCRDSATQAEAYDRFISHKGQVDMVNGYQNDSKTGETSKNSDE